jgi:ABC-type multidrug transport system fused ATPase/permease subunit
MDEATSALDNQTEKEIIKSMYEISQDAKKTLIIVAHRLTTIENCDCIYFMRNGRIADTGSYQQLLSTNEHFRNIALVSS